MPKGKYPRKGKKTVEGEPQKAPASGTESTLTAVLVRLTTLQNDNQQLRNQLNELAQAFANYQQLNQVQTNQILSGLKTALDRVNAEANGACETEEGVPADGSLEQ